jgi:O-succinylbenzoic acid--CoA ligase
VGGLSVVTRALITDTPLIVLNGFGVPEVVAHSGPEVLVSLVATALGRVGAERFHTVLLGGSPPPPGLSANVVATYGLTETGSGVVYDGVALDGVEVALDPSSGQIRLRGPMLLRAYRDGTSPRDADGWLSTGDAGAWDAAGRLTIVGRLSDLIISGGENVWPAAVEAILQTHQGVAQVAVSGREDPEWGQRVVAWVVPQPHGPIPTLDQLRDLVRHQLAPFAAPRELKVVDRLPTSPLGKLLRRQLGEP